MHDSPDAIVPSTLPASQASFPSAEASSQLAGEWHTEQSALNVRICSAAASTSDHSELAGSSEAGESEEEEFSEQEELPEGSIQLDELDESDTVFESDDEALQGAMQQSNDMAAFIDHGNLPW